MTQTLGPDMTAIKGKQQQTWAAGDYGIIGSTLVIISEQLCESVGVRASACWTWPPAMATPPWRRRGATPR